MSDHVEQRLRQLTPRGCDPELRAQVLGVVAEELLVVGSGNEGPSKDEASAPRSAAARLSRLALCAAALLLVLAVALNVWVERRLDRRLAAMFDPPVVRKQAADVATEVASVTDAQMGRWTYRRLWQSSPSEFALRDNIARIHETYIHLSSGYQITAQDSNAHEKN